MYSPEFPFSVYPVRPGVYQVHNIYGRKDWDYSYWDGRRWAMTYRTPQGAAQDDRISLGIYSHPPTYSFWRGLSSPSSEA